MDLLKSFTAVFLSIILEAIPFVMLGAFISSFIQIFVPEQFISKIIPRNKFLGLLMASFIGIIFPVCECAIVPIMRRLLRKGVPLDISVTFMLAVPIVNPVVMASTYYAFSNVHYMVFLRCGLGLVGAIIIGYLTGLLQENNNPVKSEVHQHSMKCCSHGHCHNEKEWGHSHEASHGFVHKISGVISHTGEELYDIGKLLIIGACISSFMQTFVSRELILTIGQGAVSSTIVMMVLAYVLSLCSEADAFIARTFMGQFTTGSITAFLVLGPMIDIKNTFMLCGGFKTGFVIKLIALIFSVCFIMASVINMVI